MASFACQLCNFSLVVSTTGNQLCTKLSVSISSSCTPSHSFVASIRRIWFMSTLVLNIHTPSFVLISSMVKRLILLAPIKPLVKRPKCFQPVFLPNYREDHSFSRTEFARNQLVLGEFRQFYVARRCKN